METQETNLARRPSVSLTEADDAHTLHATPPVDVYENRDEILVLADFPGVPTDTLSVRLEGSELLIEGTQPTPKEGMPLRPLSFSRAFRVPNTVDPNKISAELSQGVLRVRLAKSEAAKPKRIQVRSS